MHVQTKEGQLSYLHCLPSARFVFCQFNETDRQRHSFRFSFLHPKTRNLIHHFRLWFWWCQTHHAKNQKNIKIIELNFNNLKNEQFDYEQHDQDKC